MKQPQPQGPVEATPDENAMLDQASRAALEPLADDSPEIAQAVEQALASGGEMPERNLAMMALPLVDRGYQAVGGIQDDDMMEALASVVIWELIQMAEGAGLDISQTGMEPEEFAETVLVEFAILYGETHPDRLDEEDKAELAAIKAERQGGEQPPGQQTPIAQGVAAASQPQQPPGGGGMLSQGMGA